MRRGRLAVLLGMMWQRVLRIGALFVLVFFATVTALYYLEQSAPEGKLQSFADALWFGVVTMSTVGYGDLYPMTGAGRLVTGVFILFTLTTIGFLLTAISEAVLEVKRMEDHGLIGTHMTGHTVVCGWSLLARAAVEDVLAAGRKVALLCERQEDIALAREHGTKDQLYVTFGEASQELLRGRLNAAEAVSFIIAFSDDVQNVIASLNARAVNPRGRVVVALQREELRQTLIAGGVTYVASANEMSGRLLASATFEPEVARLVEDMTSGARGDYDLQQYCAGPLGNATVIEIREKLHEVEGPLLIAVAVKNGEQYEIRPHPPQDLRVSPADTLIMIANREQARRMVERYQMQQGR